MEIRQLLLVVSAVVVKLFRQTASCCVDTSWIVNNIKGHVSHVQRKRPVWVRGMRRVRCEVNNSAPDGNSTQLGSYCSKEELLLTLTCIDARRVWVRMSCYLCEVLFCDQNGIGTMYNRPFYCQGPFWRLLERNYWSRSVLMWFTDFCFQKQELCGYLKLWTLEAVVKGEETKQMVTHNKKCE